MAHRLAFLVAHESWLKSFDLKADWWIDSKEGA